MAEEKTKIDRFEIEIRLDCTIRVNETDYFKPGMSAKIGWNRLPEDQDVKDAATYLQFHVIDPTLTNAVEYIMGRVDELAGRDGNAT